MTNAEEHKKLLDQVAELEKKSVNYFNVEDEFFLIDSNNLSQIRPRLYGYSIQETGIYEDSNLTAEAIAGLDGRGCYVYVGVKDGKITIQQDSNGCWGIYLFQQGDYFALSNSFFRLLDHIKLSYPVTLNRDYANHILTIGLRSLSFAETPVNEIQVTDRNAVFSIDIRDKTLCVDFVDYQEDSYSLDSAEGIALLDHWFHNWINILQNLQKRTNFISVDLSGGYDSRLTFLLVLKSGIDMNAIRINSAHDNLYTHAEDYRIASTIANHFGFILNKDLPSLHSLNYSLTDILNIEFYTKLAFHKEPYFTLNRKVEKLYRFSGYGGEAIRDRYSVSADEFIDQQAVIAQRYPLILSKELYNSTKRIIEASYLRVHEKYGVEDRNSSIYPHRLYRDASCRYHYGKSMVSSYFANVIGLAPLMDSDLRKLRLSVPDCPDNNLLMALIYMRYCPELVKFPYEGKNYSLSSDTLVFAQRLNERFPLKSMETQDRKNMEAGGGKIPSSDNKSETPFNVEIRDAELSKFPFDRQNNRQCSTNFCNNYLKALFDSTSTKGLFTAYFDQQIYDYANRYYRTVKRYSIRHCYSVLGITRVLEDVMSNSRTRRPALYQNLRRPLDEDFYLFSYDNAAVLERIRPYITARIDMKLFGPDAPDFQIFSLSDEKAAVSKPQWLQKNGTGYVIASYRGELEMRMKAGTDGQIRLTLRGIDARDPENASKRIPYWIDYTSLSVNGTAVFNDLHPTWHDKPYVYGFPVKTGEEITVRVAWLPHKSDT